MSFSKLSDSIHFGLVSFVGSFGLATGLEQTLDFYSKTNSIRNAIYAQADKITPEVIEQANELAKEAHYSGSSVLTVALGFTIAIIAAADIYHMYTKKTSKDIKSNS